jgi:hypothetical protein
VAKQTRARGFHGKPCWENQRTGVQLGTGRPFGGSYDSGGRMTPPGETAVTPRPKSQGSQVTPVFLRSSRLPAQTSKKSPAK